MTKGMKSSPGVICVSLTGPEMLALFEEAEKEQIAVGEAARRLLTDAIATSHTRQQSADQGEN